MKQEVLDLAWMMDWNVRTPSLWDWDNPLPFDSIYKLASSSDGGAAGRGGGVSSGSEFGNVSSSKSSISVSTDSSSKAAKDPSLFDFEAYPNNYNECLQPPLYSPMVATAAAGPEEPLISLKLGKRAYFEDVTVESNAKKAVSSSVSIAASSALMKKSRVSNQGAQSVFCQVEGCNADLSSAKDYHRKHRVCEDHTKSPRVVVAGQERRFCQQCSRFHDLSEFDEKKRSCRRRLSDHNARRRKPQPDIISFNSATFSFSAYDDKQMNFLWNKAPSGHMRPSASSTWEGPYDFKLPQAGGQWITKAEGVAGELHTTHMQLSNGFSTLYQEVDKLLPFKATTAEVLNQGSEVSTGPSELDGAPGLRCALSLLSSSSWVSPESGLTSLTHLPDTKITNEARSLAPTLTSITNDWQIGQSPPEQTRMLSFTRENSGSHLNKLQLQTEPYGTSFLDSNQIY